MPTGTPFDVNPLPQVRNLQHRKSVSQRVTYNVSVGCLCVSVFQKGPLPDCGQVAAAGCNITLHVIVSLHLLLLLMKISERAIIYNIYMCNVYEDMQSGSIAYTQNLDGQAGPTYYLAHLRS